MKLTLLTVEIRTLKISKKGKLLDTNGIVSKNTIKDAQEYLTNYKRQLIIRELYRISLHFDNHYTSRLINAAAEHLTR